MKRPRLARLGPSLAIADLRTARPPAKTVDPHYQTAEHEAWAADVIARAGGRCEFVENGRRCWRRLPEYRMYAHHIVELADDGAPLDPANGKCLCASHHTRVTNENRDRRNAGSPATGRRG